jgi:hypothetical protein
LIGYYYFVTYLLIFVMEYYISRNTKKYQVIEKFKMGDPYCNDPRCQRNQNGERHKAHVISEKLANIYFGENYCNDPRCQRNRNGERHEAHNERLILKESTAERFLILLRYIRTVMTQGARQTGQERDIDRIPQTIHILIILNIWAVTKHIPVIRVLECTFTKTE